MTDYEKLCKRCAEKEGQAEELEEQWAGILDRLLDAKPKDRPALIAERVQLAGARDAVGDELTELCRRRDLALVAEYEERCAQAEQATKEAAEKATTARLAVDEAEKERRWFNGRVRPTLPQEEGDRQYAELEGKHAQLRATALVTDQATRRAASVRDHSKAELDAVRKELGL